MTASEGQDIAKGVVKCLETMRSDRDWELFWEYVNQGARKLDLPDAEPPRKRRRPQKYEEKDWYHQNSRKKQKHIITKFGQRFTIGQFQQSKEDLTSLATKQL